MEPLLPEDRERGLEALAWQVVRRAERLGAALHPLTAASLRQVVRVMNSYYSHLIEGHETTPADLEAVLRGRGEGSAKRRELQQLHFAHLEVEEAMVAQLVDEPGDKIVEARFLQALHQQFYDALPVAARGVEGGDGNRHVVHPGQWRQFNVSVGHHLAPAHEAVPAFMQKFAQFYGPLVGDTGASLLACAAAHHRLAWIHPCADGNGRVARLFSQAWLIRAGADAHGLWSISRGLARRLPEYRTALANADGKRRNDFDGRGALSLTALNDFCRFFLETCLDQIDFMAHSLQIDTLERRLMGSAAIKEATNDWPAGTGVILRDACLRGEIARGDVPRLIGKAPRTAQSVIRRLLEAGCLTSPSEKGPLRLGWPPEALPAWLPGIFGGALG